jgi:hypothetical protein
MKRDLVILVADGTMKAVFDAFFERPDWHDQLECNRIDIWPQEDIVFDALKARGYDGGVYARCQHVLNPYRATHRYALVVLDRQFGGERSAVGVRRTIRNQLQPSWKEKRDVMVIDPELEVLLWQDHSVVNTALKYGEVSVRQEMLKSGVWPEGANKPLDPKASLQAIIKQKDLRNTVTYQRIARSVPVSECRDKAFSMLRKRLQAWFPKEV